MTENKRFGVFKYPDCKEFGVSDDVTDCNYGRFDYYEAETLCEILNELDSENKELKAQLHCTHDGVCDICNNEYLVQQGKYYVSKCKKGHEECSKMDLSYCEDFELKGDGVE